ncbi:hypothetical protein GC163_15210 [bacterium]|nr:hypothetical protein [bacterium]
MGRLIRNMLRLAVVLALIAGGAMAWMYYRSDELLRAEILKQLSAALPETTVTIERANFDLRGRVRIFDLTLKRPQEIQPFLTIAETIVTVDQQQLAKDQRVLVESVRISQPQLRVQRDATGHWDLAALVFNKPAGSSELPHLEVLHGRIDVVLTDHAPHSQVSVPIEELMLTAEPSSQRSYAATVSCRTLLTGQVQATGEVPLEPGSWAATAIVEQVRIAPESLKLATVIWPDLLPRLQQFQRLLDSQIPPGFKPAGAGEVPPWELGLTVSTSLEMELGQAGWDQPLQWKLTGRLNEGQVTHAALPTPLFDLHGNFSLNADELSVPAISARNGQCALQATASATRAGGLNVLLRGQGIALDDPLTARLPDGLQRQLRALALSGMVDGQLQFQRAPSGAHQIDAEAQLSKGTVQHERFPVLLREVAGKLSWHNDLMQIQGQGLAGTRPVQVWGTIHHPGPTGDAVFDVRVDDVLLDDSVRQALPDSVGRVVDDLQFQGRGDVRARFIRPSGLNQKYDTYLLVNVRDSQMRFQEFPYPLSKLSGRLRWHDAEHLVAFEELRAEHDGTTLTGAGQYRLQPSPGQLNLAIDASNAAFDRALYAALPASLQEVWTAFSPQGRFDARTVIGWTPGQPVQVEVPRLQVLDANVLMRDFRYPFRDFQGVFRYEPLTEGSKVVIEQFSCRHDDTRVNGQGEALCHPDNTVTVSLSELHVDDLSPSVSLRSALPQQLQDVIEILNPSGRFSFAGPVKLYGDPQRGGLVGAAWDFQVLLAGCALNAGLRLDDIHGRVHFAGRWTPRQTELSGQLDLDAFDVWGNHQLTKIRGPFQLKDGILVMGSAQVVTPTTAASTPRVTAAERISAQAFDGEAMLDAVVDLNHHDPDYRAHLELNNASLEKYAMRHLRGFSNVRGLMNGWMDLRGRGVEARGLTGNGQLQISPAALYELPVFLQIFQLPQFAPIDRTAFNYANFIFRIDNERFNFEAMDLVGNTLSLRGRGMIRFDGAVLLDFFTMQPRNPVRVPGLRELVGVVGMVSQGWVAVEVRGPISAPVARVVPFPAVDEALQQFLGAFDPRAMGPSANQRRGPSQMGNPPGESPRR